MPNWCESDLTVTGSREAVTAFKEKVRSEDTPFSLNSILPMPEELRGTTSPRPDGPDEELRAKHGADNWYDWACEHWGTKWDANTNGEGWSHENYGDEHEASISFKTAWAPPLLVIRAASLQHPDVELDLRYFECGMEFNGVFRIKAGEVERDAQGDYFGTRGG